MDWAIYTLDFTQEGRRKVNLFSYVLGYSRRQYLRFTASQDMETTIREHVGAFQYMNGVAATCLYDNMKTVVARYEDGEPIYNTRFLAFAAHYGFRPVACRPRRPQTKGKVERQFRFVREKPVERSRVPLPGTSQRGDRLVAEGSGRRAHASADAAAADRPARRRTSRT